MASFGEELKRERELRDISLKEISEATKISIRFLEALEQNNYDILPGGIFNRGFIRAYARFIGVDGEELVNAYAHEMTQREARLAGSALAAAPGGALTNGVFRPEPRPVPQRVEPRPERESRGREIPPERRHLPKPSRADASDGRAPVALWGLAVVAILVVAGVVAVGLIRGRDSETTDDLAQARLARASRKAGTASPRPAGPDSATSTAPGIASAEGALPAGPVAPGEPPSPPADPLGGSSGPSVEELSAGTVPATRIASTGTTGEPAPAEPAVIEHTIRVQATEVTRVRLVCASRLTLDQELWPGQARTLACAEPVLLGADNAGAVQYSLDHQPAALLGTLGERVEELQLAPPLAPADGVAPTPGSSPTPPGGAHGRP
jgi:transcriptional regulator with XRE-family HTH domain